MPTLKFKGYEGNLQKHKYSNGRLALTLTDGTPIATLTVNLPDEPLRDGFVFIKDYAENEGVLQMLLDAGIVELTPKLRKVKSGFVEIPCVKINEEKLNEYLA